MIPPLDIPWLAGLPEASLRGSLILLAALAVTRAMHRESAAARHLVWTLALGGVLTLPLLGAIGPVWTVPVLPPAVMVESAAPAPVVTATAAPSEPAPMQSAPLAVTSTTNVVPVVERAVFDWRRWVPLLWLLGAVAVLLRLIGGLVAVWWLERRAVMVTDGAWLGLAHALAQRLGLQRGVTLLRGKSGSVPMTWGVLQPIVWLPADAEGWTAERRTVVLAHELAHVRRRDALTQWIAHLAVAVHWFNPLVWMAARQLREERERACDDAVIALGTRPAAYADHLLELVRSLGAKGGPAPVMAMARRSQFEGRLLAILDGADRRGGVSRRAALGTALAAGLVIVPIAAVRATSAPLGDSRADGSDAATVSPIAGSTPTPRSIGADTLPRAPIGIAALAGAMRSDAGRADLLAQAVEQDLSDQATLREVARVSGTIESASQRARVLSELAEQPDLDETGVLELLRATSGVDSDSNRRFVLEALLGRSDLSPRLLVAALGVAAEIGSSSERRFVLETFLDHFPVEDPAVRRMFFSVLRGIPSNTERRFLLEQVLETQELCDENLHEVIVSASGLGSDSEKRFVLTGVAERASLTGKLREAYLAATRTMTSDSERATALSALLGSTPLVEPATPVQPATTRTPQGRGIWNSVLELVGEHQGAPSFELTLRARDVVRGADRGDIREILPGGSLWVEETIFPGNPDQPGRTTTRSGRAAPRSGGGVRWSYRVNGAERPWDAEGRAWLSALLRQHAK